MRPSDSPGWLKRRNIPLRLGRLIANFSVTISPKSPVRGCAILGQKWVKVKKNEESENAPCKQKSSWPYVGQRQPSTLIKNTKNFLYSSAHLTVSDLPRVKLYWPTDSIALRLSRVQRNSILKLDSARFTDVCKRHLLGAGLRSFHRMSRLNKSPSWIQFLSTPTVDTPGTALLLFFDDRRYIIGNVHEGLARACIQAGKKLAKVSDIFITGKIQWKNTGGLIGTTLCIADTAVSSAVAAAHEAEQKAAKRAAKSGRYEQPFNRNLERQHQEQIQAEYLSAAKNVGNPQKNEKSLLKVHGGPNITHTLATGRRFIFRIGMPVSVNEFTGSNKRNGLEMKWKPDWADERIQVWYLPVTPTYSNKTNVNPEPESPLKRKHSDCSIEQIYSTVEISSKSQSTGPTQFSYEEDQKLRNSVIHSMFHSSWRHNDLEEVPLSDVKLPATIFIRNEKTETIERYNGPKPGGNEVLPRINVLVKRPWPAALITNLPPTQPSEIAMSYIIRNHPQRGQFRPERAEALNVPRGRLWGKLAAGMSVQSSDGQIITPDMVLDEGNEGNGVAVIDIPSSEYVHDLVTRPEWQTPKIMVGVEVIVWILGTGVSQNNELQKFIQANDHLIHIMSSSDHCPNNLAFDSSASATIRLHQIDPSRFPIPIHNNVLSPPLDQNLQQSHVSNFICAQRGLKVQLEPKVSVKHEEVLPILNTAHVLKTTPQDVLRVAHIAQENILSESAQQKTTDQNLPSPDAEIICLGTGSALPSKYRNVSGTLLRVPGHGSYLLDCGENTLGQLKRLYNPAELSEVLRDLKLIWISHLHADHHLGTTSVIKAWHEEVYGKPSGLSERRSIALSADSIDPVKILREEKRLFVVSSSHMIDWLREYSSVEDYGYSHLIPLCSSSSKKGIVGFDLEWDNKILGFNPKHGQISLALKEATGLTNLEFCYVNHCLYAQAVSLTFSTGFKFSYSGDCRPSERFARIGKGSTVLLHEATFDDELRSDAEVKNHSTTSEAIGVGIAMGARRILLTHFSQRYQNIPILGSIENQLIKLEDEPDPNEITDKPGIVENIETQMPDISLREDSDLIEGAPQPTLTSPHPTEPTAQYRPCFPQATNSPSHPTEPTVSYRSHFPSSPLHNDLKIGIAFDYMRVKVGDIIHLEKFTPALQKLYEKSELDDLVYEGVAVTGGEAPGGKK